MNKENNYNHDTISLSFEHYKQETWQGACELYAFLWGCLHSNMKDALTNNINETDEGYEIKSSAFNSIVNVKNDTINNILAIPKNTHCTTREYNPSNDHTLIAIGLACATLMKVCIGESLEEVGKKEGYLIDRNGTKKANLSSSGDILLNNQIHYLPSHESLLLKPDGTIAMKEDEKKEKPCFFEALGKNNFFIIYPHYGHAHLYYFENNGWKKFDNQKGVTSLGNKQTILTSPNKDRIRIIVNQSFEDNKQISGIKHAKLMDHLAICLNVDREKDVCYGDAVENRIVQDAGIHRNQKYARFRPLSSKKEITFFDLTLNSQECCDFLDYYATHFPGLIVGLSTATWNINKLQYGKIPTDQQENFGDIPLRMNYIRFFMRTSDLYNKVAEKWKSNLGNQKIGKDAGEMLNVQNFVTRNVQLFQSKIECGITTRNTGQLTNILLNTTIVKK